MGGGGADATVDVVFVSTICGVGDAVTVTAVVDAGTAVVVVGVATAAGGVSVRVREAIAPTIPAASRIAPSASPQPSAALRPRRRHGHGRGGAVDQRRRAGDASHLRLRGGVWVRRRLPELLLERHRQILRRREALVAVLAQALVDNRLG